VSLSFRDSAGRARERKSEKEKMERREGREERGEKRREGRREEGREAKRGEKRRGESVNGYSPVEDSSLTRYTPGSVGERATKEASLWCTSTENSILFAMLY
jgi:hypothetical protein